MPVRFSIIFLEGATGHRCSWQSPEQAGVCLAWLSGHSRVTAPVLGTAGERTLSEMGTAEGWAQFEASDTEIRQCLALDVAKISVLYTRCDKKNTVNL